MKKNRILIISIVLAIAFVACPIESTRNITAGIGFILGAFSVAWLGVRRRKGAQKGIRPILGFFIAGVAMGVLTYLDITGLLLYLLILSVFALETAEEETVGFLHRMWAALLAAFGHIP